MTTVKMADHIYVSHASRVVESGMHRELVRRKDGTYAHCFAAQASGYR
jgi:ABC-type multidrug transport system fused ATPase/permease subunit